MCQVCVGVAEAAHPKRRRSPGSGRQRADAEMRGVMTLLGVMVPIMMHPTLRPPSRGTARFCGSRGLFASRHTCNRQRREVGAIPLALACNDECTDMDPELREFVAASLSVHPVVASSGNQILFFETWHAYVARM